MKTALLLRAGVVAIAIGQLQITNARAWELIEDSINTKISEESCKDKCREKGDNCRYRVTQAYANAHAICRLLDDDGYYPYEDNYYACMTALGFGDANNPYNPEAPGSSLFSQRQACAQEERGCIRRCEQRAREEHGRNLRGAVRQQVGGILGGFLPRPSIP